MPLVSSLAVPLEGFRVAWHHAPPVQIHSAQIDLTMNTSFSGSPAKPIHRLGIVLLHAMPKLADHTHIALSKSMALIRSLTVPGNRSFSLCKKALGQLGGEPL